MSDLSQLIDLHTHTTSSDGSFSPTALVKLASQSNLRAVAITDHDTIDGVNEAIDAGKNMGMEVVPGVEISTNLENSTVHILGYFIDTTSKELHDKLDWAKGVRADRNNKIIEKFNGLGIDLTLKDVAKKAGNEVMGRPHFAQVLLEKGVVQTVQEAFDKYLAQGAKAYVDKFRFTPDQSIGLINRAGGLAVLAHPGLYKWSSSELDQAVKELSMLGLVGIEVLYSTHTPSQSQIFHDMAKRNNLLPTGGSDFHGLSKPDIKIGAGKGDLAVPYAWLNGLKNRLNQ